MGKEDKIYSKHLKWDEKLCAKVMEIMNEYPDNLKAGFEKCAQKLGGTYVLYQASWYSKASRLHKYRMKKGSVVCAAAFGAIKNYKNNRRNKDGEFTKARAQSKNPEEIKRFMMSAFEQFIDSYLR